MGVGGARLLCPDTWRGELRASAKVQLKGERCADTAFVTRPCATPLLIVFDDLMRRICWLGIVVC